MYNVILNTLRVFKCLTKSFRMNDIEVQYTQHSGSVLELSNSILAGIIRKKGWLTFACETPRICGAFLFNAFDFNRLKAILLVNWEK